MKIKNLEISDFKPIKNLAIRDLGDVVIIAGANGSGKTRLMQAIIQTLQGTPVMDMTIEATRKEEEDLKYFGSTSIEIKKGTKNKILTNYINSRKYGAGRYVGSLVQIDSNRSVQTLKYSPVNWLGGDPDDLDSPSNFYFQNFSSRWQDFVNYIHQKSASRDKKLADELIFWDGDNKSNNLIHPPLFQHFFSLSHCAQTADAQVPYICVTNKE